MTSNPAHHMYTCHLLGAYLRRNIILKTAKTAPLVMMCEPPEVFSVEYFFNKGLLQTYGKETFFYEVGDKVKTEAVPSEEVEELRNEMQVMRKEMTKEIGGMRKEFSGVREELKALRENVADLAVKTSRQNERTAEAVELMLKMTKWLEKTFSLTQQKVLPGSSGEVKQPGHDSSSVQRLPHPPKSVAPPSVSKPVSTQSVSKSLLIRKPVPQEQEKEKRKCRSCRRRRK